MIGLGPVLDVFLRVLGYWTRACSGYFSSSPGVLDSGLFWMFLLESRGIGLGPVLDVSLRVQGLWTRAGSECFSYSPGGLDSGLFWM